MTDRSAGQKKPLQIGFLAAFFSDHRLRNSLGENIASLPDCHQPRLAQHLSACSHIVERDPVGFSLPESGALKDVETGRCVEIRLNHLFKMTRNRRIL